MINVRKWLVTADGVKLAYHLIGYNSSQAIEVISYYLKGVRPGRTTANFIPPEAVKNYRAEELKAEAE